MVVLVVEEEELEVALVDHLEEEVDLGAEEEQLAEEVDLEPEVALEQGVELQEEGVDLVVDESQKQIHIRVFSTRDMHLLYNLNLSIIYLLSIKFIK